MTPPGLTLHVNDYDDEGTVFHLIGRGHVVGTYSIWDVRAAIMARLTPEEREQLAAQPFTAPEHFVLRVIAGRGDDPDPDYDDPGPLAETPWAA